MKAICSLSVKLWIAVIFITALAGCSPAKESASPPIDAINNIRERLKLPQSPLEFVERTGMSNSPSGGLEVENYRDGEGRIYSVEPKTNRVVEMDARALLTTISPDMQPLLPEELKARALAFAKAVIPDFDSLQPSLQYEEGGKVDNYFFSWYGEMSAGSMSRPFLQFAFHQSGILFAYYNTLSLED